MSAVLTPALLDFRPMYHEDLDEVIQIEHQAYEVPWTQGIMQDCLRVGYDAWLAADAGAVVAYSFMSVAVGEAHLLNITVNPALQRCGIGSSMLQHMLDVARIASVERVFLEVRPSNSAAIALYHKAGFEQIGSRRDYYPSLQAVGREDALVLALELTPSRSGK